MTRTDFLDIARQVMDAQPFSRLVGTRVTACGDGHATLEVDVRHELLQQYGLVHGGVFAYLADNAVAFAAGSALGPSVVSTGLRLELVGNVRVGTLVATADVVRRTAERVEVDVEITADHETAHAKVCARANGTARRTDPRARGAAGPPLDD
ncbi:PaaI family thioesterase [Nocardioides jensenii]|uniref:PaaI family thioesterase n=1 Tax=Nocardioides jensenii TaxID=1843 RepID=UPI00083218B6|nr:PaaI family thioesterase [Nocardioides jensenii]